MKFQKQPFFKYDSLPEDHAYIRLITIHPGQHDDPIRCQLTHALLDNDSLEYDALSYTWGAFDDIRWIWVNDVCFCVQPNLREALLAIRKADESVRLWVDAICIDQGNHTEKSHQIRLMGKTYGLANTVIAWLGPLMTEDELVFAIVSGHEVPHQQDDGKQISAFQSFGRKDYWSRAWVRQELLLAKNIVIYCGSFQADWNRLSNHYTLYILSPEFKKAFSHQEEDPLMLIWLDITEGWLSRGVERKTLECLLRDYGHAAATDVRDKVYSLLSLAVDCQKHDCMIADYEAKPTLLFFALMEFCAPENQASFAQLLGKIFSLRADEVTVMIHDREALPEDSVHQDLLREYARKYLGKLRKEHESLQRDGITSTENWQIACALSLEDTTMIPYPSPIDLIFQIGRLPFAIVMRRVLAGFVLYGLARQFEAGSVASWFLFNPFEEYNDLAHENAQRLMGHRYHALNIVYNGKDYRRVVAKWPVTEAELKNPEGKMLCLTLQCINQRRKIEDQQFYHLDMQSCQKLIYDEYDHELQQIGKTNS